MAYSDAKAGLLVIVGEPLTEEQTQAIYQRVVEGVSAWDHAKFPTDLKNELLEFVNKDVEAEIPDTGGTVLRSNGSQIYIEFLINPSVQTLYSSFQNFLTSPATYKLVIFAGPTFLTTGSWILRDGTFSFHDFARLLHRSDVATALTEITPNSKLFVSCFSEGEWTEQGVKHHGLDKYGQISVGVSNGTSDVDPSYAQTLQRYLQQHVQFTRLKDLMPRAHLVGSIRFRRPTIYIFPSGQGDAALFGVDGFLMVLDGGFQRKTCFWDFLSHVDHLDAILISRLNSSNVLGTASFLDLLASTGCAPKLGHVFGNIPDAGKPPANQERNSLLISLYDEGTKIFDRLARLGLKQQTCAYVPPPVVSKHPEPITLYEKVGQGRLEMYVLNPFKESKEFAEFVDTWKKRTQKLPGYKFSTKPDSEAADYSIPLTNRMSAAVLIVWKPYDPEEPIVRVLYPGSCPQEKILNGLEKLKSLDFLKYPYCTGSLLEKKLPSAVGMKAALLTTKPSTGKTAAELLAEGAKAGSIATKATSNAYPLPTSPGRREVQSTTPPSNSPTQMQSPPADSDGECVTTENGNSIGRDEGEKQPNRADVNALLADGDHRRDPGYSVEAEPSGACAYELADGSGADQTNLNEPVKVGPYGRDQSSKDDKLDIVFEETAATERGSPETVEPNLAENASPKPKLVHSSLNPNAQPFYPRSSQSSADSSPESVRKMVTSFSTTTAKQSDAVQNEENDDQDANEIQRSGCRSVHQFNVVEAQNAWGEPLGLPTVPNKKETTTTSSTTTSRTVKPSTRPPLAIARKNAPTKEKPSEPAKLKLNTMSTAKKSPVPTPSPKISPTVPGPVAATKWSNTNKPTSQPVRKMSATTKSMPMPKKQPTPVTPCYFDLVYVPHQGNPYYCNTEFFKYVRSKYYVVNGLNPPKETFDALLSGKKTWNCQEETVTIIPTYDSNTLMLWMGLHKEELIFENIDIAPSCARCSVNLEEPAGATCAAYRLEL